MNKILYKLLRKVLTYYASNVVYRKYNYGEVCCCGASFKEHTPFDNHTIRDLKEYTVTCWVDSILKEKNNG